MCLVGRNSIVFHSISMYFYYSSNTYNSRRFAVSNVETTSPEHETSSYNTQKKIEEYFQDVSTIPDVFPRNSVKQIQLVQHVLEVLQPGLWLLVWVSASWRLLSSKAAITAEAVIMISKARKVE